MDDGRYWPVVAEFFVTVLAVFVLLYAQSERIDPGLQKNLDLLRAELEGERSAGNVQHSEVSSREVRIVYSAESLGFEPCEWGLGDEPAERLRRDLERLKHIEPYVGRLSIEGHADLEPATNCQGLRFKSNFELSENRAMSVFAALLGHSIEELDGVVLQLSASTAAHTLFVERMTAASKVLVAGFGATRLFEDAKAVPNDRRHRRVEIRVTLERETVD